jgi:hypothetical protein
MVTASRAGEAGKTRLALSVAAEAGRERRDGVWFVDLLHETDPAMVTAAVAQAAGVPEQRDRVAVAHVTSRLATQRASCGRRRRATVKWPYCAAADAVSPGLLEEPEGARALRGLDSRAAVELREQVADVHVDGALAEEQPRRDLPVRETFGREPEHLHLAA